MVCEKPTMLGYGTHAHNSACLGKEKSEVEAAYMLCIMFKHGSHLWWKGLCCITLHPCIEKHKNRISFFYICVACTVLLLECNAAQDLVNQALHCMCMFSMQHDTLTCIGGALLDLWWGWMPTLTTQHMTSEQLLTLKTYLMDTVSDHFNDYALLSRALEAYVYSSQMCITLQLWFSEAL